MAFQESFLFIQIFSVLCNEKNFEQAIAEINSRKSIIKEQTTFEKFFEFKALIERFCGDFEQSICDFKAALEYGYDKEVAQFNIASVFYSIATNDNGSGFHLNLKIKWDKLLVCHTMLIKLLSNLPTNDLKHLLLPDILKLHLNCCMLLEKYNNVYLQQDLVAAVWDLDYDSIRSFILTTPDDIIKQNNYISKLNESDSALWNIHQKIDACNYTEAEAIAYSGLQRDLFPHPVLIYDILLQISLNQSDCKKYIMYLMRSMAYCGLFLSLSTGIRVRTCDTNWKKLREIDYLLPDLLEQQNIANFLDAKCAEIDALAADIQTQIDTLEQYKRSVITEAITKGLNPDVEMACHQISWIEQMPAHWKIIPSKYLFHNSDKRKCEGDQQLTASQKHGIITQQEYMERENSKIVFANQGLENWKHVEPFVQNVYNSMLQIIRNYAAKQIYPRALLL